MPNKQQLATIERNGYTLCETFMDRTISIRHGRYYVHDVDGMLTALPASESRANARLLIRDRLYHS